jgi:hypothetical protein
MSAERLPTWLLAAVAVASAAVTSADALGAGRASSAGPSVQSMIVGSTGAVLSGARTLTAGATNVHVGGKSCAVAAGTPLATLAAARRAGGPGFAVRDYGHCGSASRNSAQLFVYSIGGQTNSAQNGWEYKVDEVSGTTGAGDPSGPRGDGRRLRSGARVLWFWCHASGGGCQRTLAVTPAASTAAAAGSLKVRVLGYDNEGRGTPVRGAIVTLGSDFASTDAGGHATLITPSERGRYSLTATRNGLVTSFPETIVVR